jgi:ketosteroid isomerase-like protein
VEWLRTLYDEWGRGNFRAGADGLAPDFEALELEPVGERVLARVRQTGRFRATGIDVDVTYFHLWSFRGGRAIRFQAFEPTAETEARAAARQ